MGIKKQTAVEWLFEQVVNLDWRNLQGDKKLEIFNQAKAMEKEQIIDAFTNEDNIQWDKQLRTRAAEQYYNEQYGGNK
jgi:Mg/Co/Ni transporter MgtE